MVALVIIVLLLGILYGYNDLHFVDFIVNNEKYIFDFLIIIVGFSIGMNKGVLSKMKQYGLKIFIVPLGIIIGTILGGILCSFILNMDMNVTTAIACGMGWYSLSGLMLTNLTNATIGSITFLSNLMREILTYISVPILAKKTNYLTAIAPAGATSVDTTLPIISKCTDDETTIFAVINGLICSTLVSFLIEICFKIF